MDNLFKNLQYLRAIAPDASFARRSREIILATRKKPFYQVLFMKQIKQTAVLSLAMGLVLVLFFILSSVSKLPLNGLSPALLTSLNNSQLKKEQQAINFHIQFAKAQYHQESARQVTMALTTIFEENASTPNVSALQAQSQQLDELLQRLTTL